jgi:tetratricopeptide (TPR) repeat protein
MYPSPSKEFSDWDVLLDFIEDRRVIPIIGSDLVRLSVDAVSHVNIGDMLAMQGNQAKALEEHREALNIRKRLVAQEPDNAKWQRKLAAVHSEVATQLMAQGDLAAARKEQQNALEIAQRLAGQDPDNAQWKKGLAINFPTDAALRKSCSRISRA